MKKFCTFVRGLNRSSHLQFTSLCLLLMMLTGNQLYSQVAVCSNCNANDVNIVSVELVQLNPAYPTDPNKYLSLPATCSGTSTVTGYIKITGTQQATTRFGLLVDGDILKDGVFTSIFQYCDPANTSSGGFTIYVENAPILWTCGTKLEIRNLFVGWGINSSSSKNACSAGENCDLGPHCAQFPLHGEPPIVVVTPLSADFSATGSCSASQTAQSYSFNALDATNGTTGGTPPYPANAYSWTIVNKSTSVQVGTLTGATPSFNFSSFGTGTYTISLTVTDDNPTAVSTISKDITVTSCCTTQANAGTNGTLTVCAGTIPSDADLFAKLGGGPDVTGSWSHTGLVYTYTVPATAPCTTDAKSTVTVTEQANPNAGISGTLTVCAGTTPSDADLFAKLGGGPDVTGSWSHTGLVYTYTVAATSPCTTEAKSTVTVTEQAKPNAGINGTLTVCAGTTPSDADLFAKLGGGPDVTGSWSHTGLVYTYTVAATSPCTTEAKSTVTVTEQANPNAGISGTLTVCAGTTPSDADLFAKLGGGPDVTGSWSHTGLVYTYTVAATSPCTTDAKSTVTVTEQAKPNAGINGTLTVCAGTTPSDADLFAKLGGGPDVTGSWSHTGLVYTYTVAATSPCTTEAKSTVTVTEQAQPNAGISGTLTVCAGTTPSDADLFAKLGGGPDVTGSWSHTGLVYTYTVAATSPCTTDAKSTVTVTEQAKPNAGTNGTLTVCAGTTPSDADLFAKLGGGPDVTGSWSHTGLVYTYTVAATSPCTTEAKSTVTVTEQAQPNAGTNGTLTVCAGTVPTYAQLLARLGGSPSANGSWSGPVGGVYTYTVAATSPCTVAAKSTVTVTEQAPPNAGTNGTLTVCAGTVPTYAQLFASLGGSPSASGSWSGPIAGVYTYTVAATSPCTVAAKATVTVTTNPNVICASYNGDYFANTASTTTGGSAVVTLKYNLSGTGTCNNISTLALSDLNVTYVSDPTIGSVTLVAGSKSYSGGVFTAKYTITLSPSAYSGTVQFTLNVSNPNFTISPDCPNSAILTVSTLVTGFVTGGGFIIPTNSGGTIGGTPVNGQRENFGFNIKSSSKKLQGNWNTIIRRMENGHIVNYQVKSNTAATLVVTKISNTSFRADMSFTSANFQNLTCPTCPVNANNGTVLVSVYDNGEPAAGIDRILITVKDKNGNTWYTSDKAASHSTTYTNLQLLDKGNIQIHTNGGAFQARPAAPAITQVNAVTQLTVATYPNPFTDKVKFNIVSPVSGNASLDVYNVLGQKVANVYSGYLSAGTTKVVEYKAPVSVGSLIYTLKVGDKQVNGKVIQVK